MKAALTTTAPRDLSLKIEMTLTGHHAMENQPVTNVNHLASETTPRPKDRVDRFQKIALILQDLHATENQ